MSVVSSASCVVNNYTRETSSSPATRKSSVVSTSRKSTQPPDFCRSVPSLPIGSIRSVSRINLVHHSCVQGARRHSFAKVSKFITVPCLLVILSFPSFHSFSFCFLFFPFFSFLFFLLSFSSLSFSSSFFLSLSLLFLSPFLFLSFLNPAVPPLREAAP